MQARGTGTLERQFWKQDSLHLRISLDSHLTVGECWASHGRPRMRSTVGPSSTRSERVSLWKHPIWRVMGGDRCLIRPRPSGFP